MSIEFREEWLAAVQEEILEPERPIVDPHHHFFDTIELFPSYDLKQLWADTGTHNVEQTVYIECTEHYHAEAPEALQPVGETEWAANIAAEAAAAPADRSRIGAIVGTANLCLGSAVRETLEAHIAASPLFRGIRDSAIYDSDEEIHSADRASDLNLYGDPTFREGFAQLAPLGLSFDAYHYHTQTTHFAALARAFPETTMVLDHLGTPLGTGPYASRRDEVFEDWRRDLKELAPCTNVSIKLGGMAMPWSGFGFDEGAKPPSSDEFVAAQERYYHHAIEVFGPDRCMFESNFPVDRLSISYAVLWNAFKKIASRYNEAEKESLFRGTATRVYRLEAR
jgi:predicted TIM-barrel fold metal-dependent hydrolase